MNLIDKYDKMPTNEFQAELEKLIGEEKSNFLKNFKELPMRDHNSMDEKGVTKNGAKFDEEIIFKGKKVNDRLDVTDWKPQTN